MSFFSKLPFPLSSPLSSSFTRLNLRHPAASTSLRLFYRVPLPSNCTSAAWGFSNFREIPLLSLSQSPPRLLLSPWRSISAMASASAESPKSVYDFTVKDARGNDVNLGDYKGKVLLIVNVASQCGLTNSNYKELSQVYDKYKTKGLEILAFPCNQFGGQEPGSNEQIVEFACTRFKAEYPIFDKVDVNGEKAAPIYKFLKSNKGELFGENIKWNFAKFLVNKEGKVVDRYAPTTSPLSIEKDIKKLLGDA